MKQILKRII